MIRTGAEYRAGLRDGREVWMDGVRIADVTTHPQLSPIIDVRARMYDMAHEAAHQPVMTYAEGNARHATLTRPPRNQAD